MNGMIESPKVREINELCAGLPRTALQVTTNKAYQVIRIVPGQFVDVRDTERRPKRVEWDDWVNADIWRMV